MADGISPRLDRVARPDPARPRSRDQTGKEALYSTAPGAEPTPPLVVGCRRCEVERGVWLAEARTLLRPPFLLNPVAGRLWARCPTCHRRSWLRLRMRSPLQILLDRAPVR